VRGATGPVIIVGDFNSKSPEWGSPLEDRRGRALAELLATLGLTICNEGSKPTFVRGTSESHLDLTLATQAVARNVTGWSVLEEESLSLHRYIQFDVALVCGHQRNEKKKGWAFRKLDLAKLNKKLSHGTPPPPDDAEAACKEAIAWLTDACDACMPRTSGSTKRRLVFWWNSDIAEQRKKCVKARRLSPEK